MRQVEGSENNTKAKIARERLNNDLNLDLYLDHLMKTWEKWGLLWIEVFCFYINGFVETLVKVSLSGNSTRISGFPGIFRS
jgi:hypothetical protein